MIIESRIIRRFLDCTFIKMNLAMSGMNIIVLIICVIIEFQSVAVANNCTAGGNVEIIIIIKFMPQIGETRIQGHKSSRFQRFIAKA